MTRFFKISRRFLLAVCLLAILQGCIKNDIPFARIPVNFLSFEVEHQDAGTVIDSVSRTITVTLDEQADIYNVSVTGYSITPGGEIVDNPFMKPLDLSKPFLVTLRMYQDWLWKITAVQDIVRYFEVTGQMGATVIDAVGRRIVLSVRNTVDLAKVEIVRAKLGPEGSTMIPNLRQGTTFDARHPFNVRVEAFGRSEVWTIYVETVSSAVTTSSVDAWTRVAWAYGMGEAGRDNGFEYCLDGDTEWVRIPADKVTSDGGSFKGLIEHLDPQTSYRVRAYSGEDIGEELTFTTGQEIQVPNSDFDQWWLDGKVWCPWAEGGTPYWDTGNKGATTLGSSNTMPTEDTPTGSGWAAMLETRFVGIGILGKLAAGNLFAGSYVRTDGTNGILSFGRPFTERPTRLKGMFKYNMAPISHSSSEFTHLIGQPDTCIVWVSLIDTDEPFEIRTNPKNRQLFDPDGSYVVAYGKMEQSQSVGQWIPFTFELNYKSTSRKPKYILITCSASKYGDYFTGGAGSVLYLDDFVLEYDY